MTKSFYTNVHQLGNKIAFREIDENGRKNRGKVDFHPRVFVPTNKNTGWVSLDGENLAPYYPGNIKDTRDFLKQYEEVSNIDIHGNTNWAAEWIYENYPETISFDSSKIRKFVFDIEVESTSGLPSPKNPINFVSAITLFDSYTNEYHVFHFCSCSVSDAYDDIVEHRRSNENEMLKDFVVYWSQNYPHVVSGWNSDFFDISYLVSRIELIFGENFAKKLSPFGHITKKDKTVQFGNEVLDIGITGISRLDYLNLYKKHILSPRESYKLDNIAHVELGSEKLSFDEHFGLDDLYNENPYKFLLYNYQDVKLVVQLDEKLQLFELAFTIAYYAKINYEDTFSPVKTWETMAAEYLKKNNIAVPPRKNAEKDAPYEGAYVKHPKIGFSDWVVSFDLASLYPSLIIQYNIGPDKMLEKPVLNEDMSVDKLLNEEVDTEPLKTNDCNITPNGVSFSNEGESFFASMMKMLYRERKGNKKQMLDWKKEKEKIEEEKRRRNLQEVDMSDEQDFYEMVVDGEVVHISENQNVFIRSRNTGYVVPVAPWEVGEYDEIIWVE